jgi:hypothetical protein
MNKRKIKRIIIVFLIALWIGSSFGLIDTRAQEPKGEPLKQTVNANDADYRQENQGKEISDVPAGQPELNREQAYGNLKKNDRSEAIAVKHDVFRKRWKNLSSEQKDKVREIYKRLKELSPEKKAEIIRRYKQYKNLPTEQKKRLRRNWRKFNSLSEREKTALRKKYSKWINLSEEEKRQLKKRQKWFKRLPDEDQRLLREKRKIWQKLSPERKKQLRKRFKKRFKKSREGRRWRSNNKPKALPDANRSGKK